MPKAQEMYCLPVVTVNWWSLDVTPEAESRSVLVLQTKMTPWGLINYNALLG